MNDGINATSTAAATIPDIGGLDLLGCGLNRMDWNTKPNKSQKVCDTDSNPKSVTINKQERKMGANVAYFAERSEGSFDETFSSSEQYHRSIEIKAAANVKYGAFSGGFSATFGRSIDSLKESSGALHSREVNLWELTIPVTEKSTTVDFKKELNALPNAFDPAHPEPFFRFFGEFGTDIVHQVMVGGTLNYALLVDKSHVTERQKLEAMVKAEYGAFFSAKVDVKAEEECKKNNSKLSRKVTHQGGSSFQFDETSPENCYEKFKVWRESLPDLPGVVSVQTAPVFQFVSDPVKRKAVEQAYQWQTSNQVSVEARWGDSVVVVGKSPVPTSVAESSRPAMRIVFVNSATHACSAKTFEAPASDAPEHEFSAFWNKLTQALNTGDGLKQTILLSTEHWPRNPRYVPSAALRAELRRRGAHNDTFERWDRMTKNMHPCLIAGATYVLVESSVKHVYNEGLAFGFAKRGGQPEPSVTVKAHMSLDVYGMLQLTADEPVQENSNTAMYVIRNTKDHRDALSVEQQDNTKLEMKKYTAGSVDNVWYFHALEKRNVDPYKDVNSPHLLINYETCGVLQGDYTGGICRLRPIGEIYQDDVIWDVRSDGEQFNFPLVHWVHKAMNLTQVGRHVAVRGWEEDFMRWTRTPWQG